MTETSYHTPQTVILLHGLARTSRSMRKLEKALQQAGYHTCNIDYPSRKFNIENLSEQVISEALKKLPPSMTTHFVTHSLGGILVRQYLQHHSIDNLGRVVMLGPPNHGSQIADWLQPYALYHRFFGPVAAELGTDKNGPLERLGSANFDLGIIAGSRAFNILCAPFLPKPNDGQVTVESTRLEGMKGHICLPVSHPFMMSRETVIRQVLHYLQQGQFDHEGNH
jgi:pimeloyl-ACP methyl ester carboxylesterase